ncbi:hypothetical protein VITFI_CDS2367 [Vitreoscilla filiformis]|uniref:Uncharacterized protein n=1 Tax=Vitreoscilla filiformis TaxID=63 RepID=A0A221KGR2_VITFI|nr:hypothetical protein VITFI_CDS2367 [Vitreoscilla filiformis]
MEQAGMGADEIKHGGSQPGERKTGARNDKGEPGFALLSEAASRRWGFYRCHWRGSGGGC